MLNKKAQSEDTFEYIMVSIAVVVGILVITFGHNAKEFSIDAATNALTSDTEILSYDSTFISTDLKNILDIQVSEEYTFAELISRMPAISNSDLLKKYSNNVLGCNEELFNLLNAQLEPVYSDNWIVYVFKNDEMLFFCTPIVFDYSTKFSSNMTIPSLDPKVNLDVRLEVYT
jgi:hypothetical protein